MSDAPAPVTPNGVEDAPGHKVFAGNLAYSTTDEGLKAFFAPVQGDVTSAQVIYRGTRSAGYGFVAFTSADGAEKAVALLHKKELDGREVIVEVAKPLEQKDKERSERRASKRDKRAGRRGSKAPPGEVTEAEANGNGDKLEGAKSEGDTPKPKKKKAPRKKKAATKSTEEPAEGTAPPTTAPPESTEDAAKKRTPRTPRKPRPARPAGEAPVGEPSKNMLFVANLGFAIDDAGLAELFTAAGIKVESARVVRRRWGQPRKSKGYGFVDVGDEDEQKKAIEALQGKSVAGREIAVKIAVNTQDREEGGGDESPETTVVAS